MDMILRGLLAASAVSLAVAGAPVAAKEEAPACAAPALLPPELAGWTGVHIAMKAAATPGALDGADLPIGRVVDAALVATPSVTFAVAPAKPGNAASHGGLFALTIRQPGTYRIALSTAAWVDVIAQGKPAASDSFGHGPDCSGIRKIVDFKLGSGRHIVQLSASDGASLTVLVTAKP